MHSTEKLSDEDAKKFFGGKGIAIRILFNELRPKIDPLGPENKLVYAIGPFAATGIPLN
jgi:aldehyde:ferredoxin oxidoreductase